MKIEFKERRTSVTQEDLEERENIAKIFLEEAKNSKYSFGVVSSKYRDSYENVDIGTLSGTVAELSQYFQFTQIPEVGVF